MFSLAHQRLGRPLEQVLPPQCVCAPPVAEAGVRTNKQALLIHRPDRCRPALAGRDLLDLEQMALVRIVQPEFHGEISLILHQQRAAQRDVFDVVGAQLNVDKKLV